MRDGDHMNLFVSREACCQKKFVMGSKNDADRSCSDDPGAGADLLDQMSHVLCVTHDSTRTENVAASIQNQALNAIVFVCTISDFFCFYV